MDEQREEIDNIDYKILELYERRLELTDEIGRIKRANGVPIEHDREREEYLIAEAKRNHPEIDYFTIREFYFLIFDQAIRRQLQRE